jgi:hypothetical protein
MTWAQVTQKLVLGATDPEELLAEVAAFGLARRGGRVPPASDVPPIPAAPAEKRPQASTRIGGILTQVMASEDNEMLRECCLALHRAGLVVPYRQLPDLLAAATARSVVRDAVGPALGTRGRWLAERRPAWSWASGPQETEQTDIEEILDLSPAQRKAALAAARKQDPERFRSYLAGNWAELRRVEDRKLLVGSLIHGLTAEDEPLLEQALDDRSTNVREEAVELLRRLPGSALSKRAEQRLRNGLTLNVVIDLDPEGPYEVEPTKEELRDSPVRRTGSARLKADASSVSPDFWVEWFGPKAPRMLRASPWGSALLQGVAANLRAAGDPLPWLTELASAISSPALLDALDDLSPETLSRVLIKLAGTWNHDELDHFCVLLPSPWTPDVTRVVLERFAELADRGWRVGRPPEVLLRRGDLRVLSDHWQRITTRWPVHGAEELVLRLRTELHEEIERRKHQ